MAPNRSHRPHRDHLLCVLGYQVHGRGDSAPHRKDGVDHCRDLDPDWHSDVAARRRRSTHTVARAAVMTTRAARETNGVLPYVPAARDPLRLSQAAVNAVDAIGERTAKELEASADELE